MMSDAMAATSIAKLGCGNLLSIAGFGGGSCKRPQWCLMLFRRLQFFRFLHEGMALMVLTCSQWLGSVCHRDKTNSYKLQEDANEDVRQAPQLCKAGRETLCLRSRSLVKEPTSEEHMLVKLLSRHDRTTSSAWALPAVPICDKAIYAKDLPDIMRGFELGRRGW